MKQFLSFTVSLLAAEIAARITSAQTVRDNLWITSGDVRVVVTNGKTIYIGGWFTHVGGVARNTVYAGGFFKSIENSAHSNFAGIIDTLLTAVPASEELARGFQLSQNYPNPFNPATVVRYQLPIASYVTLRVYNVLGQEVKTLVNEEMRTGSYDVRWDASGMYFYQLAAKGVPSGKTAAFIETKKLLLVR